LVFVRGTALAARFQEAIPPCRSATSEGGGVAPVWHNLSDTRNYVQQNAGRCDGVAKATRCDGND
jgi:hypothetical protein